METATSAGHERPVVDPETALRFLAEASAVLAGSLDYEATVQRVADLLVPEVADWCGVDVLEPDGTTRQLTSRMGDAELEAFLLELRRRYRQRADQSEGTQAALQENLSVLVSDATGPPLVPLEPHEHELYNRLAVRSYMIVPLIARGRTLGAVTLISRGGDRHYTASDLAFAEHLARRFALGIDNARLFDQAERSLALLDTLFASAPIGLAFLDDELRYVRVNAALAEMNGVPVEDHAGRTIHEVLPEAEQDLVEQLRRVLDSGEPATDLDVQVATQRDPGQPRLFNASYYPVRSADGEVIGVGVVVTEITERQRVQIALAHRCRWISCAPGSSTSVAGLRQSAWHERSWRGSSATPSGRSACTTCSCSSRRWSRTPSATAGRARASTSTCASRSRPRRCGSRCAIPGRASPT
jgi:PAS domain S-box-containing protein